MKKTLVSLTCVLAVLGGMALAAPVDADGDGVYSMDEVMTAYPDMDEDTYAQIDTDGNGDISMEEFDAALEAGIIEG